MKGKIIFKGHFLEYFVFSLGLLLLSALTLGLLLPYYFYWTFKYFFTNMEIEIEGTLPHQHLPPQDPRA